MGRRRDAPQPRDQPPLDARARPTRRLPDDLAHVMQLCEVELAQPFRGIAGSRGVEAGLFPLVRSGVSTEPLRRAATELLTALNDEERRSAAFPVASDAWRLWNNTHPYLTRHGLCLETLDDDKRARALALVASALSERAFCTVRDVMRLNETLRELTGSNKEYGEWLYWLSTFGVPSETEPWGFQLDGHHVNVNCLVLGDQVVVTPTFLGSEPVVAPIGRYLGTRVLKCEEAAGLRLAQMLSPEQFRRAVLDVSFPGEIFAGCYRDNLDLDPVGIAAREFDPAQRRGLVELLSLYVGWIQPGHAAVRLSEILSHLDETVFAWIGGRDDDSVFYYRVHSPVVLVEFDHLAGVAFDNDAPSRNHIHTIVRTPNGNDYGRDLLRQHYQLRHNVAEDAV